MADTADSPLVDTHAHIYTLDMPLAGTAWHKPPASASAEEYIATLDSAGVQFGVIAAASIYGDYNDYTLDALRRYKRLRATVIVAPDTDISILRQMNEAGVVGIRFQFRNVASPPDLAAPEYRKFLRRIADLGWHVHLHDDGHRLPNYIPTLLSSGPSLVIDHMGRPDAKTGLEAESFKAVLRAVEQGNTWVKISAGFRIEPPEFAAKTAARLLKHAGPQRLMWGSDWPFAAFEDKVTYGDAVAAFRSYVPQSQTRRAIDKTSLDFYFS